MSRVTYCTKFYSYWSGLCSSAYAVCRCYRDTPAKVSTESRQPYTFCPSQKSCAAFDPTKTPR